MVFKVSIKRFGNNLTYNNLFNNNFVTVFNIITLIWETRSYINIIYQRNVCQITK